MNVLGLISQLIGIETLRLTDPIVVLYFFGAASIAGRRLRSGAAASIARGGFDLGRVLESRCAAVNHELRSRSRAVERERAEKESRE